MINTSPDIYVLYNLSNTNDVFMLSSKHCFIKLLTNQEDTSAGWADSIGAQEMYIFGKRLKWEFCDEHTDKHSVYYIFKTVPINGPKYSL